MAKSFTKREILSELAGRTGHTQKVVDSVLNELTELIYREAANDFTLPGLCKFKVARRKQSKRFNVATGRHYIVAAHDVLKIVPLKKAKMMIAPPPTDLFITELPAEPPPAPAEPTPMQESPAVTADAVPAPPRFQPLEALDASTDQSSGEAPAETPAAEPFRFQPPSAPVTPDAPAAERNAVDSKPPEPASVPQEDTIDFECPHCGATVSAPSDMRGAMAECPMCRGNVLVPVEEEPNPSPESHKGSKPPAMPSAAISGFVTFYCDDCGQEIEAPTEMVGLNADCPACGSRLEVPEKSQPYRSTGIEETQADGQKSEDPSMTIRMDLSDFLT